MKIKFKHFATFVLALSILAPTLNIYAATPPPVIESAPIANSSNIKLVVNNKELTNLPMAPVIYNDYTLVPARETFEALGAVVDWKSNTNQVYISYGNNLVILEIDNKYANVNNQMVEMQIPPKIINGKTMVPLRFLSDVFGFDVRWDSASRTAYVSNANPVQNSSGAGILPPSQPPTITSVQTPAPATAPTPVITATPAPTTAPVATAKDNSTANIVAESHPETQITNILMPAPNAPVAYTIQASSPISKVSKTLLEDNRLVIDIEGAKNEIPINEFPINSTYVKSIRVSQNQVDPTMVTRVVFDLAGPVEYSVNISEDRKSIIISFEKNTLENVTLKTEGNTDYVTLDFKSIPSVEVYNTTNPDKITIDAFNTTILTTGSQAENGKFVSNISLSQPDATTGKVELLLKTPASKSVSTNEDKVTIKIMEPAHKNVSYNAKENQIQIKKDPSAPIKITDFKETDNYNSLQYIINLSGDYEGYLGNGQYEINDDYIQSVTIENNSKNETEIIINENQVLAYNITENPQYIYIDAVLPNEKYDKIVIIDAGHGGVDVGTASGNVYEKDIVFNIANQVVAKFEQGGEIKAYATRTTDVKVPLEERPVIGNQTGDLFVSIHVNSAEGNPNANGSETHYYPHENDNTIGISSEDAAMIMQDTMIKVLGSNDRGTKESSFVVLRGSTIPAMLVEIGFISNPSEGAKLATPEYQEKIAEAIYQGIVEIFKVYTPKR